MRRRPGSYRWRRFNVLLGWSLEGFPFLRKRHCHGNVIAVLGSAYACDEKRREEIYELFAQNFGTMLDGDAMSCM
jgi:hypothetical protein